jgi:hypothetical protein
MVLHRPPEPAAQTGQVGPGTQTSGNPTRELACPWPRKYRLILKGSQRQEQVRAGAFPNIRRGTYALLLEGKLKANDRTLLAQIQTNPAGGPFNLQARSQGVSGVGAQVFREGYSNSAR